MHSFQVVFIKKVSKEKGAMLDGTKTQSDGRKTRKLLSNKIAKPLWVHERGLDTFYPMQIHFSFCSLHRGLNCC